MPVNVVKTADDERYWEEAKKSCPPGDWECVMGTFQRIKANAAKGKLRKRNRRR